MYKPEADDDFLGKDWTKPDPNQSRRGSPPEPARPVVPEPEHLKAIHIYYHGGNFYSEDVRGTYDKIHESQARRELYRLGFRKEAGRDGKFTIDEVLTALVEHHRVDFVGQLSGRMAGLHRIDSVRALVTSSPTIIQPEPGNCPLIDRIMLGTDQSNCPTSWAISKWPAKTLMPAKPAPGKS